MFSRGRLGRPALRREEHDRAAYHPGRSAPAPHLAIEDQGRGALRPMFVLTQSIYLSKYKSQD